MNTCAAVASVGALTRVTSIPKRDDGPAWFKRLGIDRTCRLVGMHAGMVTLTHAPDDMHTVWLYDHPLASGDRTAMRTLYADHMRGHWLEPYYRS
jgi:hypothetical protein